MWDGSVTRPERRPTTCHYRPKINCSLRVLPCGTFLLRPGFKDSEKTCHSRFISVIFLTGDNPVPHTLLRFDCRTRCLEANWPNSRE